MRLLPILLSLKLSPQEIYEHAQLLFEYSKRLKSIALSMIEVLRGVVLNRVTNTDLLLKVDKFFQLSDHPNPEFKYPLFFFLDIGLTLMRYIKREDWLSPDNQPSNKFGKKEVNKLDASRDASRYLFKFLIATLLDVINKLGILAYSGGPHKLDICCWGITCSAAVNSVSFLGVLLVFVTGADVVSSWRLRFR